MVGWLCALGWQCGTASGAYLAGTMIQGLLVLSYPPYTPTRWQGSLFLIGISLIGTIMNTYGAKHLPKIEATILVIHVFGFLCILVPLWALAPKTNAATVFTEFNNGGGWPNIGVACMVGQIAPVFAFIGPDSGVHLCMSRSLSWHVRLTFCSRGSQGRIEDRSPSDDTYRSSQRHHGVFNASHVLFLHYRPTSCLGIRDWLPIHIRVLSCNPIEKWHHCDVLHPNRTGCRGIGYSPDDSVSTSFRLRPRRRTSVCNKICFGMAQYTMGNNTDRK
jgi:Amino acid permease